MTTLRFAHDTLPQRLLFGFGEAAAHLRAEIERAGSRRPIVITSDHDPALVRRLTADIAAADTVTHSSQHVPAGLADEVRARAEAGGADLLVAIGGGSTTGIAKSVALDTGLPIVAVPTTYAGSEATPVWGRTTDGRKVTGVDPRVLPRTVIYDAELTMTLPVALSVSSGLNALAHCVDSLWAPRRDPVTDALAEIGMRSIAAALPRIVADGSDLTGREQMLLATYYSAQAFAGAGSGLHHKICHVLGGRFDLPHAQTHAVVLPYVLAFNAPSAGGATTIVGRALDAGGSPGEVVESLAAFGRAVGAPRSLGELGLREEDLAEAAELCTAAVPASNPRPAGLSDIHALLSAAHAGRPPHIDLETS
jgi:alcohol dehydrogenase class IV